jgi:hypothetical protein
VTRSTYSAATTRAPARTSRTQTTLVRSAIPRRTSAGITPVARSFFASAAQAYPSHVPQRTHARPAGPGA